MNKMANVCLRINPDVGAHTHANITTGLAENKFGISLEDMDKVIAETNKLMHINFIGLHFHIGSQILDMGISSRFATVSTSCRPSWNSNMSKWATST